MIVYPFNQTHEILGDSEQGHYLYRYLTALKANTFIVEENYIDKDYLIDYSKFYARSFENHKRFTKRIHFFSESFSDEDFRKLLEKSNKQLLKKVKGSYLGFIVIKPIKDSEENPLIGRTILKTYSYDAEDERRFFLIGKNSVSLFGIPLNIDSLPFQTQDKAVGACATTALWISLQPLSDHFGVPKYSPIEVTEMSVSVPGEYRNFPSSGLHFLQMKNYFNTIGLETETINIAKLENREIASVVVTDAVRAYVTTGFPIIATLVVKKGLDEGYHAVVISGFRHQNGILKELYVHDDQIGPYSRVKPHPDFTQWKNEWIENYGYTEVHVEKLLVPIYPKIRLAFNAIYTEFLNHREKMEKLFVEKLNIEINTELYLMQVKDYKKLLLEQSFKNKEEILITPLPRFLWIFRTLFHGIPLMDYIYDGTAVFPNKFDIINFKN